MNATSISGLSRVKRSIARANNPTILECANAIIDILVNVIDGLGFVLIVNKLVIMLKISQSHLEMCIRKQRLVKLGLELMQRFTL